MKRSEQEARSLWQAASVNWAQQAARHGFSELDSPLPYIRPTQNIIASLYINADRIIFILHFIFN
jgi:hypothetical protein